MIFPEQIVSENIKKKKKKSTEILAGQAVFESFIQTG